MILLHDDFHAVTAADLVRSFPACRDRATNAPLYISNHGRNSHVLVGVDQFKALLAAGSSPGAGAHTDELHELADWMDDAVIVADRDLRIGFANRVAHAVCRKPAASLNGRQFAEALPEIAGTMLEVHARRTLVSSEPSAADLPSPFADHAWLRFQTFPIGERIVMIFRDISEDVQRHRLADVKKALLQAMDAHGAIGYIRASLRGTIDRVDGPFCAMLGLPEERLINLPLVDLVTTASRPDFRAALDHVIRGGPARRIHASLVSNKGEAVDILAAMAPLHGAYGSEGAVILTTPLSIA